MQDEPSSEGPAAASGDSAPVSAVERLLGAISWLCMLVAGVCLVVLIVIFGWLVWGRYVMNDTPTWVEQAALLLVVYIAFLGAAVGVRENSHLSIDFIREAMPAVPRAFLRSLSDLLLITFGGFMAWQGWVLYSTNLERKIPMVHLSESWRALPLGLCGLLIILFCGARLLRRLASHGGEAK